MSEAMKPCPVADELERRAEAIGPVTDKGALIDPQAYAQGVAFGLREAAALVRQSSPATAREVEELRAEADEMHDIGHRDGYETAVQDIDLMTGGDGEYFASTIPGEGCPDAATMKAGIERRFEELRAEVERLREALGRWSDNLKITRNSPIMGDVLHGPALDFVIEQLDDILASKGEAA